HAVSIEILVENGLLRLQRRAGSRHYGALREEVAAAVGGPNDVLVGAAILPNDLIAAATLLRTERSPCAELTHRDVGAGHLELRTCRRAMRVEEIRIGDLGERGRAGRLDRRRDRTGRPVVVEILSEGRFERLQRVARAGHHGALGQEVATAVGGPHGVLIGAAILPNDLIAAATLLHTERRPRTELTDNHRCTGD